jgi:Tfp pilus assembly protein PilF
MTEVSVTASTRHFLLCNSMPCPAHLNKSLMPVAAAKPAIMLPEAFRSPAQHRLVLGLLLVVVTLALFNPLSHNGFVNFDDDRYVTDNSQVRSGLHWSTVAWAFTSFDLANWHPLTWLSHALDCQFFGLNPTGHHYTNLLLHTANALLLFLVLQWFTGYTTRSLMVAALFAVHPLNVESVAWVAERKNLLCMFFLLLTLAAYGRYVRRSTIAHYLLAAVLFALALMSKPMAITLPALLLLLDYWPLRRFVESRASSPNRKRTASSSGSAEGEAFACSPIDFCPATITLRSAWFLFLEKAPLLLLSIASAVVTMVAQRGGGAVLTSAAHNPLLRIENAIVSYALYIEKALWPARLAVLYPYPRALSAWQVAASALFLLAVTGGVLKYHRHRYLVVGWFWYLGTMVPMIGLVQVGNQAMADRYAYLPAIGLFIMVVWAVADCVRYLAKNSSPAKILAPAAIIVLLAFSAITRSQLTYWHDDLTLWRHALDETQNNFVAENNFASALINQGRGDEAIIHFRAASALEPGDPTSQLNLGIYAQENGDLQQAAARYNNVLRLATDTQLRASAYANLGTVAFALHDYPYAQQNFDSAIKLGRVFPVVLLELGIISERTAQSAADYNRAAGYFSQFVALEPSDVGYLLLADALRHAGRLDDAKLSGQRAMQLSADVPQARQQAAKLLIQ